MTGGWFIDVQIAREKAQQAHRGKLRRADGETTDSQRQQHESRVYPVWSCLGRRMNRCQIVSWAEYTAVNGAGKIHGYFVERPP